MSSSSTDVHVLVDVAMPAMGTSIVDGTLIAWHKAPGDRVDLDEVICEVSTDKVDTECPSPAAGVVIERLVEVGETVEVGTVLARIACEDPPADARVSPSAAPAASVASSEAPDRPVRRLAGLSPVVARIVQQHGLDASRIPGNGRGGRITKQDALAALAAAERTVGGQPRLHSDSPYQPDPPSASRPNTAHPPGAADALGGVSAPLSRMRQVIGATMLRSQAGAATCHTVVECDMSRVEARRRELGTTALPIVARVAIEVLRDFPDINATLDGATITRYERVHLGIAVALGADGLIVPVVRDAQNLSAEGLSAAIKDLAGRARQAAQSGGSPRRDVHDHQPGRGGSDARNPGHRPAAGRDSRPGGDHPAAGGGLRR